MGKLKYRRRITFWTKEEWTENRKDRLDTNLLIAAGLKEYRTKHNVPQVAVAELMGISAATLSQKESGTITFSTPQIRAFRLAVNKLNDELPKLRKP